ncbi:MAG: cytochrome ubiquinol oxidase subunit I [Acidobacteria bacterium]|nr:cytochrome ubiquinol oxidase subunit I [Acidobacteriota bacterium]MBS1866825.1 cytochrome ubiquinol oxidase subunit I [Acidobacteriota bacterium]
MEQALDVHRLHFAFTITYHYIFPQLTMGLALLILYLKTKAIRTNDEHYNRAARFWARIFGINFALGVVTGIPMEFQFGTNWAEFSKVAGGVIGQTLAMEGVFSFFLESSFLGLFLFGEKRLGPIGHWWSAFLVWLGSWLSGYFIVATDAWMQRPIGYRLGAHGEIELASFWGLVLNKWTLWQYAHTMVGAVQTGCFVMAAVGAFYLLTKRDEAYGRTFVRTGVIIGVIAACLQLFPTGDMQGKMIAESQPVTLAAMEGLFETQTGAPLAILGQPDVQRRKLDNPLQVPRMLSFLTYRQWSANVKGLEDFPQELWPDRIALLYYSYHVMVGLGTIFIAVTVVAAFLLWRRRLYQSNWMLWLLMISLPLPYIANTAGWMTAELGRQPWLIYGLMRTAHGSSPRVGAGNAWFTLIGFMGMYTVLSILFLFLVWREIEIGPEPGASRTGAVAPQTAA